MKVKRGVGKAGLKLREGSSGWGTHVHPWQIYVDVWQNQCNKVKKIIIKINKNSKP